LADPFRVSILLTQRALECGSLLPLCPPASLLAAWLNQCRYRGRGTASKLGWLKAAASCRTPKRMAPVTFSGRSPIRNDMEKTLFSRQLGSELRIAEKTVLAFSAALLITSLTLSLRGATLGVLVVLNVMVGCLLATLFCYAVYPFFPLTPPRVLFNDVPGPPVPPLLRHMNLWLLNRFSVQACLFPSAHAAAVTATALAVRAYMPR